MKRSAGFLCGKLELNILSSETPLRSIPLPANPHAVINEQRREAQERAEPRADRFDRARRASTLCESSSSLPHVRFSLAEACVSHSRRGHGDDSHSCSKQERLGSHR